MLDSGVTDAFGWIAATGSCVCFIPQVILCLQSQCAKGLSLGSILVLLLTFICWLIYGIGINSIIIIVSDAVEIVCVLIILQFKIRDIRKTRECSRSPA